MKRSSLLILASFILVLQIGCGGGDSSSGSYTNPVKIALGKTQTASLDTGAPVETSNQIPASVSQIRFTISAPDMLTITRSVLVDGRPTITEYFDVPVGLSRQFLVESLDSEGNVIFRGDAVANVGAEPLSLIIDTVNTDPVPPVFSGLSPLTGITATTLVLNWSPATDNVTDPGKVQYLIYMAELPSGENFANPTFPSSPGATSYTVTNLKPATTYYFVVRAMDGYGNVDGNSVERSATTPSLDLPPVFSGLSTITGITAATLVLDWSPATDDVTDPGKIQYLIYVATSNSGENFATPTFTSSPGTTSYTVTNLNPATTYYFVVRARDEHGNVDGNSVERSATTLSPAISGRITSNGVGLAGVNMTLSGAATATITTDASGNYSFTGLANGSYTVTPSREGYTFNPASVPVTMNGAAVTEVNFTAILVTYAISGTITTSNGVGLAGVNITLSGAADATTTTGASGNYSFTGLANGSYTVIPSRAGYTFTPTSRSVTVNGAAVTANFTADVIRYAISGRITFSGGTGLAGVTMTLSGAMSATTTTDASGYYSFTGLANGSYTVTPPLSTCQAGYTFNPASRSVTVNGAPVPGVNFTAIPVTYAISGTVTSGGVGLAGVNMTLSGGAANATTTTDASGNYSFTGLVNGSYTVIPALAEYTFNPASAPVTVNCAAVTANFTADVIHYAISGTITFNGVGLAGVNMTLSGGPANDTTTTDASGNYSFTGLANGSYTVTPTPCQAGYNFNPASRSAPVNGADVPGVNFTAIYATYAISGRVTSGGVGLAGVNMTLSGAKNATTTTDESGNYSFPGLANDSYTVTPALAGYTFNPASAPVTVNCANVTSNFTASPITYYLISGTVTSYTYPQSGVTMTLSGAAYATTTTDPSGNYSFTGLTNGSYTVTPALAGYNFTPAFAPVPVNGANVPAVNFTGLGT